VIVKGFKTRRVLGSVHEGRGRGWDFQTLDKPLPPARVRGMYKNKIFTFIYFKKHKFFI